MLCADVLILEALCLAQRSVQNLFEARSDVGLALWHAGHLRESPQFLLKALSDLGGIGPHLFQDRLNHSLPLLDQRQQQMLDVDRLMLMLLGKLLGLLDGLLYLEREFVKSHDGHNSSLRL